MSSSACCLITGAPPRSARHGPPANTYSGRKLDDARRRRLGYQAGTPDASAWIVARSPLGASFVLLQRGLDDAKLVAARMDYYDLIVDRYVLSRDAPCLQLDEVRTSLDWFVV